MQMSLLKGIGRALGGLITPALGFGMQMFGMNRQADENMRLAKFQASANEKYLRDQLQYNSPENQMRLFKRAGLNPHLIYGQAGPITQSAPLQHPEVRPRDFSQLAQVAPLLNQSRLANSQIDAQQVDNLKKAAETDLKRIQTSVAKANPLLDQSVLDSVISSMKLAANLKANEFEKSFIELQWFKEKGVSKMDAELNVLVQKYDLGRADQKIKAEVLKSKEFQNDLIELQKKFMQDGDVSSGQILMFLQSLLLKLM